MKVCDVNDYPLNLPPAFLAASGLEPVSDVHGRHGDKTPGERYLIEASAGTGKTYTITHLILRLILMGVPVRRILVTTFSKAAADELKTRILKLLNKEFRKRKSNTKQKTGSDAADSAAGGSTGKRKRENDAVPEQEDLFLFTKRQNNIDMFRLLSYLVYPD